MVNPDIVYGTGTVDIGVYSNLIGCQIYLILFVLAHF